MREPDLVGEGVGAEQWRAWQSRNKPVGERGKPDWDAMIGRWLLFCPGAHAFWSYWWISLVHLRPIPGESKPAVIRVPGAQWEVMCDAQDPGVAPDPDDFTTVAMLQPLDWVVQFGAVKSDADAERVVTAAVRRIMTGQVSPDTDYRSYWESAFAATAKHFAEGGHPTS